MDSNQHSKNFQLAPTRRNTLKLAASTVAGSTLITHSATAQEADRSTFDSQNQDSTVYIGNKDGSIYAVNATTGEQQWKVDIPLGPNTVYAPTAADGTLFIGHNSAGSDPSYYAIDTESGSVEWEFDPDEVPRMTPPTINDGVVYIGTDYSGENGYDSKLYALDAATGNVEWEYTEPMRVRVAPTVVDNTVYIGARQSEVEFGVTALDASTGEVEWQFTDALGSIRAAPVVYRDKIFIIRNGVFALDRATGELAWKTEFDGRGFDNTLPPVAVDGRLYIAVDASLYALNIETGNEEWSQQVDDSIKSGAAVRDETVVIVSYDIQNRTGTLHGINAQTGAEIWTYSGLTEYDLEPRLPTIYDDTVYVTDTRLHAVDIETGDQEWIFDREIDYPADLQSPTVVANPEQGVSTDSRVQQGILGHTDFWATRAPLDGIITMDNIDASAWEVTATARNAVTAPVNQENPDISLQPESRYLVENNGWSTHPFELRDAAGEPLLSQDQDTTGSFEDNTAVEWIDNGDELLFTLTETLAEEIDTYICTVHNSMQGTVAVEDDPLEKYRNENGKIDDTGLLEAISDWRDGNLEDTQLLQLISEWRDAGGNVEALPTGSLPNVN